MIDWINVFQLMIGMIVIAGFIFLVAVAMG